MRELCVKLFCLGMLLFFKAISNEISLFAMPNYLLGSLAEVRLQKVSELTSLVDLFPSERAQEEIHNPVSTGNKNSTKHI